MIIVDRIEEGFAVVCIGELRRDIPLSELPEGAHEGSVLKETDSGYQLDLPAEQERRRRLSERTKRIFGQK